MDDYKSYSYETMVEEWGYEVLKMDAIGEWSGDWLVLLKDGANYGFVVIGYGSCSGCDMLEGFSGYSPNEDGYNAFSASTKERINWMSREHMIAWLEDDDTQETKYYWYEEEAKKVIKSMAELLKA